MEVDKLRGSRSVGDRALDPGSDAGRVDPLLLYLLLLCPPWAVKDRPAVLENCLPPLGILSGEDRLLGACHTARAGDVTPIFR